MTFSLNYAKGKVKYIHIHLVDSLNVQDCLGGEGGTANIKWYDSDTEITTYLDRTQGESLLSQLVGVLGVEFLAKAFTAGDLPKRLAVQLHRELDRIITDEDVLDTMVD